MTPGECAQGLALVAAAEGRPVDEVMVSFWLATLGVHNVTVTEFRGAIVRHYADSTYPIRPGHVWEIVQRTRAMQAVDQSIAQTADLVQQRAMFEEALVSANWDDFEAHYPGVRHAEVKRNIDWWVERRTDWGVTIPEEVYAQAEMLGITIPEVCLACTAPAVDSGEGRFCGACQDHEGTCVNDHCLTCGART